MLPLPPPIFIKNKKCTGVGDGGGVGVRGDLYTDPAEEDAEVGGGEGYAEEGRAVGALAVQRVGVHLVLQEDLQLVLALRFGFHLLLLED